MTPWYEIFGAALCANGDEENKADAMAYIGARSTERRHLPMGAGHPAPDRTLAEASSRAAATGVIPRLPSCCSHQDPEGEPAAHSPSLRQHQATCTSPKRKSCCYIYDYPADRAAQPSADIRGQSAQCMAYGHRNCEQPARAFLTQLKPARWRQQKCVTLTAVVTRILPMTHTFALRERIRVSLTSTGNAGSTPSRLRRASHWGKAVFACTYPHPVPALVSASLRGRPWRLDFSQKFRRL